MIKTILLNVVIVLLTSLISSMSLRWYFLPRGELEIQNAVNILDHSYIPIKITNRERTPIDGLIIEIPSTIDLKSIVSSPPSMLNLNERQSAQSIKQIVVSALEGASTTTLFIPGASIQLNQIRIVNNKELKVDLISNDSDPFLKILKESSIMAIFSAFAFAIVFSIYINVIIKKQKKHREETECILADTKCLLADSDKKIGELKNELIIFQKKCDEKQIELEEKYNAHQLEFIKKITELKVWSKITKIFLSQIKQGQEPTVALLEATLNHLQNETVK